jgi:hypothetical protein
VILIIGVAVRLSLRPAPSVARGATTVPGRTELASSA